MKNLFLIFFIILGRSVARQLRCEECKVILITHDTDLAATTDEVFLAPKSKRLCKSDLQSVVTSSDQILNLVNRGGLSHPTTINFTISALIYLFFQQAQSEENRSSFLKSKNQQLTFLNSVHQLLSDDLSFACLLRIKCSKDHKIFMLLAKTIFNCCASNLRRQLFFNDSSIPGENDSQRKKLRKLQSKGCEKK